MEEREEKTSSLVTAPGERNITFHHPAGSVPGILDLQAERPPLGTAWDLPLPLEGAVRDADGTHVGHDLPSAEHLPTLSATLRSNLPAHLEQVTLSHWMPGQRAWRQLSRSSAQPAREATPDSIVSSYRRQASPSSSGRSHCGM